MDNDADTVTPLDGEDGNVTGIAEQFDNVPAEDYETRGQTTVATRRGYAFVPSDKQVPVITHTGIKVTQDVAEAIVAESRGRVHVVEDKEGE